MMTDHLAREAHQGHMRAFLGSVLAAALCFYSVRMIHGGRGGWQMNDCNNSILLLNQRGAVCVCMLD